LRVSDTQPAMLAAGYATYKVLSSEQICHQFVWLGIL
jgi:hypothetical protein